MNVFKKLLIYKLAFLIMLSFSFVGFPFNSAKASTLNTSTSWHKSCMKGATPIAAGDLPFDVSKFVNFRQDKSSINKASEGKYNLHLEWEYLPLDKFDWEPGPGGAIGGIVGVIKGGKDIPIKTWSRSQTISGTKGNIPAGSGTSYSGTINHNDNEQAVFRLKSEVCWTAPIKIRVNPFVPGNPLTYYPVYKTVNKDFKHDFISDGLTLDPNVKTGEQEIGQGGEGGTLPGGAGSNTRETGVAGNCEDKCKNRRALFGILPTISGAICEGQCYIIEMMADMTGWVIKEVLVPSIGIDEDRSNP